MKRWKCEKIAEQMKKMKPTINEKLAIVKSIMWISGSEKDEEYK